MERYHFLQTPAPDLLNLTVEGERIQLISLSDKYDQDIFCEFTSAVTRYMFPKPAEKIEETRAFIHHSRQSMEAGTNLVVVITLKETGEFLGVCGLHGEESVTKPELGIWLKEGAHGHRYGREAIATLVQWAQQHMALEGFIYPVDRNNIASRKIPEALGGKVFKEVEVVALSGNVLEEVVYEITAPASLQEKNK